MVRCILIGLGLGVATEIAARVLNLWRYHHAQTPILNIIGMFGLVMGGLGSLVPAIKLEGAFAAGFAAGLVYEVLNLRVLHWWYFPNARMGFIAGHTAIVAILSLLWGAVPLAVAEIHRAVPQTRAGRPGFEERLEALNVRERRLLERLDTARQVVRDLETRLDAVRTAKQALSARQGMRPLAPGQTGATATPGRD
ncbi:hypothetical protein L6Q96_19700 [Candidatus Binatia bacterium]|nr:hypothetical protein [Candidatus Binatia bacterium]